MSYVNAGNITAMISRSNKNLVVDKYDVAEWCADVLSEVGDFDSLPFVKDEVLAVENKQALLPCHLYRLVAVRRNGCSLLPSEYRRNGVYLRFDDDLFKINIDYLSIPVDADGLPLIPTTHRQACYWYCLSQIYLEDYLGNKISADRFSNLQTLYANYVIEAKQSFVNKTANEISELNMIRHNMVRTVRLPKSIP